MARCQDRPGASPGPGRRQTIPWPVDRLTRLLPDPGVVVPPVVAVHGAQVPWGKVVTNGVPIVAARRLPGMLRALPAVLGPERVADLAKRARSASGPPPDEHA
jgi:hypothetical protein